MMASSSTTTATGINTTSSSSTSSSAASTASSSSATAAIITAPVADLSSLPLLTQIAGEPATAAVATTGSSSAAVAESSFYIFDVLTTVMRKRTWLTSSLSQEEDDQRHHQLLPHDVAILNNLVNADDEEEDEDEDEEDDDDAAAGTVVDDRQISVKRRNTGSSGHYLIQFPTAANTNNNTDHYDDGGGGGGGGGGASSAPVLHQPPTLAQQQIIVPSTTTTIVYVPYTQPQEPICTIAEYADEIYDVLLDRERRRQPFNRLSPQANHRQKLVQLMQLFSRNQANISRNTLHLAVYLLDLFMDFHQIAVERFVLVSLCCMQLAAKMEECEAHVPKMRQLRAFTQHQFSVEEFLHLEQFVLRFFQYQLMMPTAVTFFDYFTDGDGIADAIDYERACTELQRWRYNSPMRTSAMAAPCCCELHATDMVEHGVPHMRHALTHLAAEFVDAMLADVLLMQETPSRMAAACMAAARYTMCCTPATVSTWNQRLGALTRYSLEQLEMPLRWLLMLKASATTTATTTTTEAMMMMPIIVSPSLDGEEEMTDSQSNANE